MNRNEKPDAQKIKQMRGLHLSAMIAGVGILLFLAFQFAYDEFYQWLERQEHYLVSDRVAGLDIPTITPTPTPTSTPLPSPTPTPTPTPTPEPKPLPAIRIIIPKINVNQKVVEVGLRTIGSGANAYYVWNAAKYAVGHHKYSANPGEGGNIVLSGHNNIYGEVFRDLSKLKPGNKIYLYTLDEEFVYIVEKKDKVLAVGASAKDRAKHASYTAPTPEETLTLVSCWPYVTFTHRIYVIAKPQR